MKRLRTIAVLLLFAMLITLPVSCKSSDTETEKSSENSTESATQTETHTETETNDTIETEEETIVITDVMIGETLEAEYAADFSVSRVFSNDMVVQRNEHIRVWGSAPASENGKKVSGEFKGMFAEAIIENGEWCITFGARLEADVNGAEMKIYTDSKTVSFKDVLVGDVYLVIGQSNVEASVSSHISNTDAATQGGGTAAIDPNSVIRLNLTSNSSGGSFPEKGTDVVVKDYRNTKQWTKTTQSDTLAFSAIGYYFAKNLVEKTDNKIPVGVIEMGFSGAPLGSYLPNEVAEKYNTDTFSDAKGKYMTTGVNSATSYGRGIYNCHMAPFANYAIAGLVWYQGCSDYAMDEATRYNEVFAALVEYMRGTHNLVNKEFPVFVVELPSIYQKPAGYTSTWHYMELGTIRAYMGSLPKYIDNCYLAVSNDLWGDRTFFNSLHPNCKFEQGQRLADLAFATVYNAAKLDEVTGPIFDKVEFSEDKKTVTITFTNVGDGLTTADKGTAVTGIVGFKNASFGHDVITPKSATITGKDQITVVFSDAVKAVAYNYDPEDYYGETINLCNSNGCPASAFLTPYTERELGNYTKNDFVSHTSGKIGFVRSSFDYMTADGEHVFTIGKVIAELNAAGNKAVVYRGTAKFSIAGWTGFKKSNILLLGYSIDGGEAKFNSYPTNADQAVINLAGKYAKRFVINADLSKLTVGEHTITLLALLDIDNGVAVDLLTFTLVVKDRPVAPDGVDYSNMDTGEYGYRKSAHDQIRLDGTQIMLASVNVKLEAQGNTLKVAKGTKTLMMSGWAGFDSKIAAFGYAIDGNVKLDYAPGTPNQAILDAGGQYAQTYSWTADISKLDVGLHTFDVLVRIYMGDGTIDLVMFSFTLEITE